MQEVRLSGPKTAGCTDQGQIWAHCSRSCLVPLFCGPAFCPCLAPLPCARLPCPHAFAPCLAPPALPRLLWLTWLATLPCPAPDFCFPALSLPTLGLLSCVPNLYLPAILPLPCTSLSCAPCPEPLPCCPALSPAALCSSPALRPCPAPVPCGPAELLRPCTSL